MKALATIAATLWHRWRNTWRASSAGRISANCGAPSRAWLRVLRARLMNADESPLATPPELTLESAWPAGPINGSAKASSGANGSSCGVRSKCGSAFRSRSACSPRCGGRMTRDRSTRSPRRSCVAKRARNCSAKRICERSPTNSLSHTRGGEVGAAAAVTTGRRPRLGTARRARSPRCPPAPGCWRGTARTAPPTARCATPPRPEPRGRSIPRSARSPASRRR